MKPGTPSDTHFLKRIAAGHRLAAVVVSARLCGRITRILRCWPRRDFAAWSKSLLAARLTTDAKVAVFVVMTDAATLQLAEVRQLVLDLVPLLAERVLDRDDVGDHEQDRDCGDNFQPRS